MNTLRHLTRLPVDALALLPRHGPHRVLDLLLRIIHILPRIPRATPQPALVHSHCLHSRLYVLAISVRAVRRRRSLALARFLGSGSWLRRLGLVGEDVLAGLFDTKFSK